MNIDINLLHQKKGRSPRIQKIIKFVRAASILIGIVTLISLATIFVLKREIQTNIDKRNDYRAQLIEDINRLQDEETKIIIINQKYDDIQTIIEAEPDLLSLYDKVSRNLPQSTTSAQLTSLSLDENGAKVQLNFTDLLTLTSFLSQVETEEFKQEFASIEISGISFNDETNISFPFSLNVTF